MKFSKYEFNNKLLNDIILLRVTLDITWTQLYLKNHYNFHYVNSKPPIKVLTDNFQEKTMIFSWRIVVGKGLHKQCNRQGADNI